jgi:hypothetical protein
MRCRHTDAVRKWLSRCPAWQYAIITGVSFCVGMLLTDLVAWHHISSSDWITPTLFGISFTATTTLDRQRRLRRRESRRRYSVPGPMLPYIGLTPAADISEPE